MKHIQFIQSRPEIYQKEHTSRMPNKEATARIKINKLLEAAGWRFLADGTLPANIQLEPSITIKTQDLDALGENFEKSSKGFIDFLLLNEKGFPFIVLEAKSEDKSPLVGKEQARKYARSQNCRFVILSNGNLHYFWDLERGNPYVVTTFPTPTSVMGYQKTVPDPKYATRRSYRKLYPSSIPAFEHSSWHSGCNNSRLAADWHIIPGQATHTRNYRIAGFHSICIFLSGSSHYWCNLVSFFNLVFSKQIPANEN